MAWTRYPSHPDALDDINVQRLKVHGLIECRLPLHSRFVNSYHVYDIYRPIHAQNFIDCNSFPLVARSRECGDERAAIWSAKLGGGSGICKKKNTSGHVGPNIEKLSF